MSTSDNRQYTMNEAIDMLASGEDFTDYDAILAACREGRYLGARDRLRQKIKRLRDNGVIEERQQPKGFRYKPENRYYLTRTEQDRVAKGIKTTKGNQAARLYLTEGLQLIMNGEHAVEPKYKLECVAGLKNRELITQTDLEAYLGCSVITFRYEEKFETERTVIFSPHYLNEYNGRWSLVGFMHEGQATKAVHIPIDRIKPRYDNEGSPEPTFRVIEGQELAELGITFRHADPGYWNRRYADVVGISIDESREPQDICLKTHTFRDHMYLKTKPLHPSQREAHRDRDGKFRPYNDQNETHFDRERGEGYFTLRVRVNFELKAKILSFADGISVVGDEDFAAEMRRLVASMAARYGGSGR